jgi:hypothetical protein
MGMCGAEGESKARVVFIKSLPHPLPVFSQVFILKGVKVICFDTLLQVLILHGLWASIDELINLPEGWPALLFVPQDRPEAGPFRCVLLNMTCLGWRAQAQVLMQR